MSIRNKKTSADLIKYGCQKRHLLPQFIKFNSFFGVQVGCEISFGAKFKLKFCQAISTFQNAPHGGVNHSKCRLEGFRASYLEVINQKWILTSNNDRLIFPIISIQSQTDCNKL